MLSILTKKGADSGTKWVHHFQSNLPPHPPPLSVLMNPYLEKRVPAVEISVQQCLSPAPSLWPAGSGSEPPAAPPLSPVVTCHRTSWIWHQRPVLSGLVWWHTMLWPAIAAELQEAEVLCLVACCQNAQVCETEACVVFLAATRALAASRCEGFGYWPGFNSECPGSMHSAW